MRNYPKQYQFNQFKNLDKNIHWDSQKQLELRQKIEKTINKESKKDKLIFKLLPMAGVATALCIVGILLASQFEENLKNSGSASAPVEEMAEAVFSTEETLNGSSALHYVNIDVTVGSECNFYLNNLHGSYNYKYKVYAPDGRLVGESITADTQERLFAADLSKYGSGLYKIKVYTQAGNIGGKYQLRVRNY
ncbi:hypothetical protein V1503_24005 [Bacillus sp. SCS-151]|uniref:hypothetical protein n=1 Tax=Nanhaiella sioensis TaxID=3115293 RepID=UPI00397C825E